MIVFLEEEHLGQKTSLRPLRTSRVEVIARGDSETTELIELLVDLDHAAVVKQEVLVGKHSYIDSAYMKAVENACLADERVQSEVERLKLPPGASVVVEAWAYATDGMNDMSERTSMVTTS
jgi:primary-amine oxidase